MIIVRLRGGLGNQLFQYAAGRALAQYHGTELKLDLYTYTRHAYRKFELDKFNVPFKIATRSEVHRFTGSNFLIRYFNKQENYLRCPAVFAQPHYHFYEDFFKLPAEIYLSGYWQSEKYFLSMADQLRAEYQPKVALDARNAAVAAEMNRSNSVSVHLRLGDYTTNAGYQSFFGTLGEAYYTKAMAELEKYNPSLHYFFFSDAIDKAKQLFGAKKNVTFVEHNTGDDSYKDLALMSCCKHNIIANSTFSWWGAWLNANPEKKVIAPLRWFNKEFSTQKMPVYPVRIYNTKDLIPQGWIRL